MVELDKRNAKDARETVENYKNIDIAKKYTNSLIDDIFEIAEQGHNNIRIVFQIENFNDLDQDVLTYYAARQIHKYLSEKGFEVHSELHNNSAPELILNNISQYGNNKQMSSIRVKW